MDSVAIVAAVRELFVAGEYPGAAAASAVAVAELPTRDRAVIPLRLLAARSLLALRRDREAQAEIRACLEAEPGCAPAYRLLGQLAARCDELVSARIFLREALRLAPDDTEAAEWLELIEGLARARAVPSSPAPRRARPPRSAPMVPRRLPLAAEGSAPKSAPRRAASPQLPLAAGFGQHLVACGLLSELQLKAALAYKRSTGVRLGAAAVALGFVSEPKIEWASLAYHGRHRAARAA